MSAPVKPSDFENVISDPTSSLCDQFINTLLKLPTLVFQLVQWLIDDDGNITAEALRQIHYPGDLIFSAAPLITDSKRLLCDGSQVSQTTYAELYAVIGATYGVAGAGQFKLPDYRARFPVGVGTFAGGGSAAITVAGGEDKHLLTDAETPLRDHVHGNGLAFATPSPSYAIHGTVVIGSPAGEHPVMGADGGVVNEILTSSPKDPDDPTNDLSVAVAHPILPPYLPAFIYIAT